MALSSRAHAFSVEALMGRGSKRKLRELREEQPPRQELLERGQEDPDGGDGQEEEGEEGERNLERGSKSREHDKRLKVETSATAFSGDPESREEDDNVQAELQGSELWQRFHEIGTEMIITKAGRRMFPSVRIKVKGLDPGKHYHIALDVVPVDSKRYRYVYHSSQWMVAGNTDHSCIAPRLYVHPDSPCSGDTWMRQIVSFDRVKLTNNEMDDKGHIILQSMHKYKPRVHVIAQDGGCEPAQIQALPAEGVRTFSFPETEFTTVTAYQNQQITKLKIDRNPFAKGFRDPGRNRGVLDGLLETYPWRPPLNLEFKTFGAEAQSGSSSGSSPVTSNGGPPSPLNSFLSPPCSPPAFHLSTSTLGMPGSETYLHNFSLPLCYKICPSNLLRTSPLVFPTPEKPGSTNPHSLSPFMMEVPMLSSLAISSLKNRKAEDLSGQCLPMPHPANPMLYGLPTPTNVFPPSPLAREAFGCSLHPSYGFYGYNFPMPSRLMNTASHFQVNHGIPASYPDGRCNHSQWHPTTNHCL